jgi:hypothetical protein
LSSTKFDMRTIKTLNIGYYLKRIGEELHTAKIGMNLIDKDGFKMPESKQQVATDLFQELIMKKSPSNYIIKVMLALILFLILVECKKPDPNEDLKDQYPYHCEVIKEGQFGYGKPCITKRSELSCEKLKATLRKEGVSFFEGDWGNDGPTRVDIWRFKKDGSFSILCLGANDPIEEAWLCGNGKFTLTPTSMDYTYRYHTTTYSGSAKQILCTVIRDSYTDRDFMEIIFGKNPQSGNLRHIFRRMDHREVSEPVTIDFEKD